MKANWQHKKLKDLGDIYTGGTPSTATPSFWNGEINWFTPTEVSQGGKYLYSSERKITKEGLNSSSAVQFPANTLMVCTRATIGEMSISRVPASTNQGFKSIQTNDKNNIEFIYYQLALNKNELIRKSCGSTFLELSTTDFRNFEINIPDKSIQDRIATILRKWDELIEQQTKLIEAKELQKKGLMQKLLTGELRFPGFEDEVNEVPIKDIGKVLPGGTPSTSEPKYWGGEIPWCTPTEITSLNGRMYIDSTERMITDEGLKKSSANLLPKNSIIVCTRATIGDCAINSIPMTTNQGFKNIIPNIDLVNTKYLLFNMRTLKRKMITLSSGSTFLELSKSNFENIKIRLPEIEEQEKIVSVLDGIDNEIHSLEDSLKLIKLQKKGLMQQLLTGKIRV